MESTAVTVGSPEVVVARNSQLGEGAFWDHRRQLLYWVDILDHRVMAFDPSSGKNREWEVGQFVGTVVPALAGDLILALQHGFARLDLVTGKVTSMATLPDVDQGLRFNDGKCDPGGRLWAGTMELNGAFERGALYCLDTDGEISCRIEPTTISNGLAWSRDRRAMYFIDSGRNDVRSWNFDVGSGRIEHERVVIRNEQDGILDGMTIDAEGMLWIAVFGAGEVRRYDPTNGRVLQVIHFPVSQITSCAFGGANFADLYVTSAREDFTAEDRQREPLAGSLFRVCPGPVGVSQPHYGG